MNEENISPSNFTFYTEISDKCSWSHNTNAKFEGSKMPGSITSFKSIQNNYVLVYGNMKNYQIEIYDIKKNRLEDNGIIEKAHSSYINNIKHYKKGNIDFLLSSSQDNSIKLWNYNNRLNLKTIKNASHNYWIFWPSCLTTCLLFKDEKKYFISCDAYGDPNLKCWDYQGKQIKKGKFNDFVMFIDNYIDKHYNNIIITCGTKGIILINFNDFKIFRQYHEDNDKTDHRWAQIFEFNEKKN